MRLTKYVLLIVLISIFTGCKEQILHNLSETESNRLITKLYEVGISAEKRSQPDGSWALAVRSSDTIPAISALSDARVFRQSAGKRTGSTTGMLPSRETQRFQYERAVSEELELSLSALPGVLEARIHLNLPPTDPLFGREISKHYPSSGSVLLIADESFQETKEKIQMLVGGASGVDIGKISVLLSQPQKREVAAEEKAEAGEVNGQKKPIKQASRFAVEDREETDIFDSIPERQVAHQTEQSMNVYLWGLLAMGLFALGGIAIYSLRKRFPMRRRKDVQAPPFEEQLQGLFVSEEEAA